mmetsp:Transcript_2182/g.5057  ORF Transcript_2182/g.5057 Transcript_2182/m.5057 type:complete len:102 (-) Transcript_2182:590-895(-)
MLIFARLPAALGTSITWTPGTAVCASMTALDCISHALPNKGERAWQIWQPIFFLIFLFEGWIVCDGLCSQRTKLNVAGLCETPARSAPEQKSPLQWQEGSS